MAGEIDVYNPCPCGSGKKLKFCCVAIVGEMLKIREMQQHHQLEMALAALDGLDKKNLPEVWSRAWVKVNKALVLASLNKLEDGRTLISEVLQELPDHPTALAVNGLLALSAESYPAAMRPVYKAFQAGARAPSSLTSELANTLGNLMLARGNILGARQNLALAVGFNPESEEAAHDFIEFTSDVRIPWPLRSDYLPAPFAGDAQYRAQFEAAETLSQVGCWSDAAKAYGAIARHQPNLPGLWWNIALCHSWAGEDPLAVEAFKAAASHEPAFEKAVDCLVLARLLHLPPPAARVERLSAEFKVKSVSKLLSLLDGQPKLARIAGPGKSEGEGLPDGWYRILDRDPSQVRNEDLSPETVARERGQLTVFDSDPKTGEEARAYVTAYGRDRLAEVCAEVNAWAEGEIEAIGEPEAMGFAPIETVALFQDWYLPPGLPPARARELQLLRWRIIVEEVWPGVKQESLSGRSPQEAAGVPELHKPLAAAVLALDVFCEGLGYPLDVEAVRGRLGLPPTATLAVAPTDEPGRFSFLDLRRVPLARLTDEQLVPISNQINRMGHLVLSYEALREVLSRPELRKKVDAPRLCMTLSQHCRRRFDVDEALHWLQEAKKESKDRKHPLDALLVLELEELMLRAQIPDAEGLATQAQMVWNFYVPKLAGARDLVAGILNQLSLPGPWNLPTEIAAAEPVGAGVTSHGIWTPEAQASTGKSKIWLPGQS